jgi:uncharacterized protein (DUF4415 family)
MKSSPSSSSRDAPAGDEAIGELDDAFFANARVRKGGRILREATGTIARRGRPALAVGEKKEAVSIRLSPQVLAFFRGRGEGWQTMINDVLCGYVDAGGATASSGPTGKPGRPGKKRA